ncbi:MAG: DUF3078 domain-containing protein [Flavobacterium sp.]|nr:DUF3078 domain-containing protein [Candidatus Neoflavobacterium equi]
MKKLIFLFIATGFSSIITAQTAVEKDTSYWSKKGNFTLLFNQSAFNNDWMAGGTSSFAGTIGANYDFNYAKEDWTWDNKIIGSYGATKIKGNEYTTKTDDRLEFNSVVGKKAGGYWYYSFFFNAKTQFDSGFDNDRINRISHFFSPAYFQIGPGMLWKKSDNLKVNIAPATSRFIFVHKEFTALGSSYGVDQGKSFRYELGAAVNAYYKFDLLENVSVENILNLYSNYLEDPQNVDIDYQLNLVLKVNKYITTNVAFQAIYDDNARRAFQIRQLFGLGLNYNF